MTESDELFRRARSLFSNLMERSGLQVDLGYTALLFNDRSIAEDVIELHEKIEGDYVEFQELILNLAKHIEAPGKLWSLLRTADSAKEIADSAQHLAEAVLTGLPPHPVLRAIFESSEETVQHVRVEENSTLDERSLADVKLQDITGLRVICIKRGDNWMYGPSSATIIKAGDILYLRGPSEGTHILKSLTTKTD